MMARDRASKGDCCAGRRTVKGPAFAMSFASLGSAVLRCSTAAMGSNGSLRVRPGMG